MAIMKKIVLIILFFFYVNAFSELILENRFTIDTLIFDTSTNKVNISWSIDTTNTGDSITFYGAINLGYVEADISGEVNQPNDSEFKDLVTGLTNPYQVDLGHSLIFDSTLYVGIWMKAISTGNDSIIKSSSIFTGQSSKKSLLIPSFQWQKVYIPGTAVDSAFPIANGAILFKQTIGTELSISRVEVANISIDSSFIQLDVPMISFPQKTVVPLEIGFKIPALPSGIIEEQTGIYVINNGNYKFKYNYEKEDSIIWLEYSINEFDSEFTDSTVITMLIDTVIPKIDSIVSPSLLSTSDSIISTSFKTIDNITNAKWELLYARGDQVFNEKDSGFCINSYDSITFNKTENLQQLLFAETGTRILLVLSDGVNRSVKDISLAVSGDIQYSLNMNAGKWVPLYSKANLTDDSLYNILNAATKVFEEGWNYDKTEQRFFRYYTTLGSDTSTGWLEYSDSTAQHFNLEPGKVIWCKSRVGKFGIPYGKGISNSLSTPYQMIIPSGKFTDLTLPYYFSILMQDILEANDTSLINHLDIYSWQEDSSTGQISAIPVYMSDSIKTIDRLLTSTNMLNSAYTIYNGSATDTILNLPGISDTVSSFLKSMQDTLVQRKRNVIQRKNENRDNVAYVKWLSKYSGEWGKLLISSSNDNHNARYSPLPMTFGNVSVSIINEETSVPAAYASLPIDIDGLSKTTIKIVNRDNKDKTIELSSEVINSIFHDFDIFFICKNNLYDNDNTEIFVPAGQSKDVTLIAGSRNSLISSKLVKNKYDFKILNSFPNPFKAMINVKYRLPVNIKELNVEMYNSLGKKVYNFKETERVSAGNYNHAIETNGMKNNHIASGTYIVKLTAIKLDGKKLTLEKKAVCIK